MIKFKEFANIQLFQFLWMKNTAIIKAEMADGAFVDVSAAEIATLSSAKRVLDQTGATLTVTKDLHNGKVIKLNRAAGVAVTLPAATGSGMEVEFVTVANVTSNNHTIKVADATDVMIGSAIVAQDAADTTVMFEAAATSDTLQMNGTTTGGRLGDQIRLIDLATDQWAVKATLAATGIEATPFASTV